MKVQAALAALFLTAGALPALAQDPEFNCADPQGQQEMNYCSYQDYLKADKRLNAVYRKAVTNQSEIDKDLAETDPQNVGALKALKKAQRAWIDYRDGHCEGMGYGAVGGSLRPLLVSSCLLELTNNRIKELNALIAGLGGD